MKNIFVTISSLYLLESLTSGLSGQSVKISGLRSWLPFMPNPAFRMQEVSSFSCVHSVYLLLLLIVLI